MQYPHEEFVISSSWKPPGCLSSPFPAHARFQVQVRKFPNQEPQGSRKSAVRPGDAHRPARETPGGVLELALLRLGRREVERAAGLRVVAQPVRNGFVRLQNSE